MVTRPKRWRSLKRGEHRYITHSGKVRIAKPKNYSRWKNNKKYNKKIKLWEFVGLNKKIIIALYKYETQDKTGKTLELDIVGSIILSQARFAEIKDVKALMISFIVNNLEGNNYAGLATAADEAEDKYGIEVSDTDEEEQDFKFLRFQINRRDYLDKIEAGTPNWIKKKEQEKEEGQRGINKG